MPRKLILNPNNFPIHTTARCINRQWFDIPIDDVWNIFSEQLFFAHHAFNLEIMAFVLMHNHYHMLSRAPEGNMSDAMRYMQRESSKQMGFQSGRINQVWGGRYRPTLITSNLHFNHAYKYILRNPVEAGIVKKVELYKYSTLHQLLGQSNPVIPMVEDKILFANPEKTLEWLNTSYKDRHKREIQNALRKSTFKFPLPETKKRIHLLDEIES